MKKPYVCKKLPYDIVFDNDLIRLLSEASEKYGEYKRIIQNDDINYKMLLASLITMDSYKSTQIEGTNVSQDEMFSLEEDKNEDQNEIINYTKALRYGTKVISERELTLEDILEMHKLLLTGTRGSNKSPGELRTEQNWIGPKGSPIEYAEFIPPEPGDVKELMINLVEQINNKTLMPNLVQVAINHAQFETIHPFRDGNGRLGRLLISLNMSLISNDDVILYVSEVIEMYKPAYARSLMDTRNGNDESFVKYFLQVVIDQCNAHIYKILEVSKIIKEDSLIINSASNTKNISSIHNLFIKRIVLKSSDISKELSISKQTIRVLLNKLKELNIIEKRINSKEYIYTKLYNTYLGR